MLEICKKEIGSIMASLASHDMEEVRKQMEESEFAATDLESELRSNIFTKYFYKIFLQNIFIKYLTSILFPVGKTRRRDEDEL